MTNRANAGKIIQVPNAGPTVSHVTRRFAVQPPPLLERSLRLRSL